MSEFSLMDLFREELRGNMQVLSDGLIALEQGAGPDQIEPLMRAAHSIKGAARVVGIDPAVSLAHVMEECMVRAQRGQLALGSAEVDELLKGVDALGKMGEAASGDFDTWKNTNASTVAKLVHRLEEVAEGRAAALVRKSAPSLATTPKPSAPTRVTSPVTTTDRAPAPTVPLATTPLSFELIAVDPMMLELFREEAIQGAQVLREGITAWEFSPASPKQFAPLLRAIQSIKGSARLVGVTPALRLAQHLEECLNLAQRQEIELSPSDNNVLLRAVDALRSMGEACPDDLQPWLIQHQALFLELLDEVIAVPQADSKAKVEPTLSNSVIDHDEHFEWFDPSADADVEHPVEHHEANPSGVVTETHASASIMVPVKPTIVAEVRSTPGDNSGEIVMAKGAAIEAQDRVVRVKEQSLSRLMGLAGESLVEARWLQPLVASLLKLKRQQSQVFDVIDRAYQSLGDASVEKTRDLLNEVRDRLEECSRGLAERIDAAETHARRADEINSRLYNEVISSRMRPFRDGVQGFPRMVRDLAKDLGKKVSFDIRGYNTDVDREILEKLESPLNHLLRNALDHGLETSEIRQAAGKSETGKLMLEAHHNAGMLVITISDDGRGIDLDRLRLKIIERRLATPEMVAVMSETELLDFLFLPGFSTADKVTEISGRGVGLDVVHSIIQSVGGNIRLTSQKGAGTRFSLYMPITLSVIRAVLVKIAGELYAFPHHRIERLMRVPRESLGSLEDRQYFDVDGRNIGVVLAHQLLELRHSDATHAEVSIVLLNHLHEDYGVIVDSFCGEQDLVVRTLDTRLGKVRGISSSAILDDGSPILIIDVDDLRRSIEKLLQGGTVHRVDRKEGAHSSHKKRVLVVDDSLTVREVQRQILANNGYEVETAVDGVDGWNLIRERPFDLVVSDIDMPRMNGLEFVRLIKSHPRLSTVPVVIVSYKDRKEDRLRGLEVGANHYLTKSSFHDNTYLDAVHDLIGVSG